MFTLYKEILDIFNVMRFSYCQQQLITRLPLCMEWQVLGMVYPHLVTFCSGSGGGSGIISHNNLKFTSLVHRCSQTPVLFRLFPPIIEKTFQLTVGNLTSALTMGKSLLNIITRCLSTYSNILQNVVLPIFPGNEHQLN